MPDLQQDLTDSAQPEGEGKHDSLMDVAEPDDAFLLCLLYTSPSPRDVEESRMPSSA